MKPQDPPTPRGLATLALLLAVGAIVPSLPAQSTAAAEEPAIELSPFQVNTTQDRGYASNNTLSGTRTNEELRNLPNAISVLNEQFLQDIAANDFFEAMQYMVSMEPQEGGPSGQGGSSGVGITVRGIANNWQSRNGFQWYIPTDTFNTERLEANLGASGQLYGDVGAGGILNIGTKSARFQNRRQVQFRFDDWGQRRASTDLSHKVSDNWAVRLNAVTSRGGDWRDGPHNDSVGVALANTFKLGRRTQLRVDGEWGEINNRTAHSLPVDEYSDYVVVTPGTTLPDVNPALAGVQAQYTITAINALGQPQSYNTTSTIGTAGANQQWRVINGQLHSLESTAARTYRQTTVDGNRRVNVAESLIPREQQWNGPDATADRDFHTVTLLLNHRFSDRLWVELGYNLQDQQNTTWAVGNPTIRRDINPEIPAPGAQSGTALVPNPNFNELYLEHTWDYSVVTNLVHNYRLLGVLDLDLPWNIRQRLVATASLRDEEFTATGSIETLSPSRIAALGLTGAPAQFGNNRITRRHYLRDGNSDGRLARSALADVETRAVATAFNARQFQSLTTGALNAFGSYWDGRVRSSIGVRRDLWQKDIVPVGSDAAGEVVYNQPRRFDQRLWNTSLNYGAVWNLRPWVAAVANYSETFIANNAGRLFEGSGIPPQRGEGTDFGLRFSLWEDRLSARVTYFEAQSKDAFVNGIVAGNTNNANTVLYEIVNILGPVNTETGNNFTGGGANGRDLQDRESTGWEFELVGNPTPNWTLRAALTITEAGNVNRARYLGDVFQRMVAAVNAGGTGTLSNAPLTADSYINTALRLDELADDDPRVVWRPQFNTRYSFSEGRFKGAFVGGSLLWNDEQIINPSFTVATPTTPSVLTRAGYTIDSYTTCNAFLGYSRRFGGVHWQGQLNLNNLFDEEVRLGGYSSGRYINPRQLVLTSTFTF